MFKRVSTKVTKVAVVLLLLSLPINQEVPGSILSRGAVSRFKTSHQVLVLPKKKTGMCLYKPIAFDNIKLKQIGTYERSLTWILYSLAVVPTNNLYQAGNPCSFYLRTKHLDFSEMFIRMGLTGPKNLCRHFCVMQKPLHASLSPLNI